MLVQLAFVVVWMVATIKAFTNVRWEIPYIGPVARNNSRTPAHKGAVPSAPGRTSSSLPIAPDSMISSGGTLLSSDLGGCSRRLTDQFNDDFGENELVIELAADKAHVCVQAGVHSFK